ncbi:putative membrane protein, partial [Phytophthora megakarya]
KRVRTNWGRLAREFNREYCKSRVSDSENSEKYYTMKQYKDETALTFLYRLNLAAEQADVKFRMFERRREQHIKRFIKNLTDMSLRSTLQRQRADDVARGGMRQRNSNRAYVAQDDEDVDVEQPAQTEQDVDENDVAFQELSTAIQDAQIWDNPNGTFLSREDLIHEVYRIMNNVGWKPANPNAGSGPKANPRPSMPPPGQPAAFQGYQSYNNPDRLKFYADTQREVV